MAKYERNKKAFLQALERNRFIDTACAVTNISRNTIHRWRRQYTEFDDEVTLILRTVRGSMNDLVESKLLNLIINDNKRAIFFYLGHVHPDYRPNAPVIVERPPEIPVALTKEQEDLIAQAIDYATRRGRTPEEATLARNLKTALTGNSRFLSDSDTPSKDPPKS